MEGFRDEMLEGIEKQIEQSFMEGGVAGKIFGGVLKLHKSTASCKDNADDGISSINLCLCNLTDEVSKLRKALNDSEAKIAKEPRLGVSSSEVVSVSKSKSRPSCLSGIVSVDVVY